MADQTTRDNSRARRTLFKRVRARLYTARWILWVVIASLVWALVAQRVSITEAAVALAVIVGSVMVAPRRSDRDRLRQLAQTGSREEFERTMVQFVAALAMPSIIIDDRAGVRGFNASAGRQFPRLETGLPIALTLRQPALLDAINACRASGKSQSVELQLTVPNETWFEVNLSPLPGSRAAPGSAPAFVLISLIDVTQQRRINTMRSDFIANVSHELRTPLTSLTGFIDTLQGPAANDAAARKKFLGIMRSQAERMAHLINDLLSLSRIEQHQHVPPTGTVDIAILLRQVTEGLFPQAEKAGIELQLKLEIDAAEMTGDRDELYEVFENLIDNAINYGGQGKRVDIRLQAVKDRPDFAWRATVQDFGLGIPAEHVPRLTERFYRVDAESSRQKKGTGLGLAIVKHIVNRHRGAMSIRSTQGEGTTVELLFPS